MLDDFIRKSTQTTLEVANAAFEVAARLAEEEIDVYQEGVSAIDVRMSHHKSLKYKDGKKLAVAIRDLKFIT
jgi:hypothetical protein